MSDTISHARHPASDRRARNPPPLPAAAVFAALLTMLWLARTDAAAGAADRAGPLTFADVALAQRDVQMTLRITTTAGGQARTWRLRLGASSASCSFTASPPSPAGASASRAVAGAMG